MLLFYYVCSGTHLNNEVDHLERIDGTNALVWGIVTSATQIIWDYPLLINYYCTATRTDYTEPALVESKENRVAWLVQQ